MEKKRVSTTNIFAKECIVSALLQLIYEKPLSAISISELCKKAGVSRITFYRNYESKEDIFNRHLVEIFEAYKKDDSGKDVTGIYYDRQHMIHYFDYLYRHREFLEGLIYCGFDLMFLNMLNEYILIKWEDSADRYTLTAFAGSLYNLFRLWSADHYVEKAEEIAEKLEVIYGSNREGSEQPSESLPADYQTYHN